MSLIIDATLLRGTFSLTAQLTIHQNECVALLGANGSGKSTLLHAVAGLVPVSTGRISVNNRDLVNSHTHTWVEPEDRNIGLLPQGGALFPHLTSEQNVSFGLRARGSSRHASRERARDMLSHFGIAHLADRFPHQLSGGQRQRVAIARTLVLDPSVLLLDEPTVALDAIGRAEVLDALVATRHTFTGPIVFTSHDDRDVRTLAHRTVALSSDANGSTVRDG